MNPIPDRVAPVFDTAVEQCRQDMLSHCSGTPAGNDNRDEILKIKEFAPNSGLVLRLRVSNAGALVELSSKFGAEPKEAVDMILEAETEGLTVEGLSFHVGSQTTTFENYVQAIDLAALIFREARERGYEKMNLLDIGGGFPPPYDASVKPFSELAKRINAELERLFPPEVKIIAEPGRFIVATACTAVSKIIGKATRHGKLCYYIDDGVYHTFSGIIFDHCQYHLESFKDGPTQICTVFGPTCDGLDVISMTEELPFNLERGDLLYSRNIGAYSGATSKGRHAPSPLNEWRDAYLGHSSIIQSSFCFLHSAFIIKLWYPSFISFWRNFSCILPSRA